MVAGLQSKEHRTTKPSRRRNARTPAHEISEPDAHRIATMVPQPRLAPEAPRGARFSLRRLLFGRPRDLQDKRLFEHLSLIALLAWVGLGADGLSSSSYGPSEAFRTLGEHTYLAIAIAALTALTVVVIASAYGRIIEEFPHGGGGYVVASKLLGGSAGVVSGCALLVDYVLTIAVSIAASCDALFSMLPTDWQPYKLEIAVVLIVGLTILNIRGVKESVLVLTPIFALFLLTHVILIVGGLALHVGDIPKVATGVSQGFSSGLQTLGLGGMLLLLAHAYSLGGGTYTGLEAVSNGMPVMREPRVQTGRKTMLYMAISLAFTAAGLLVCYLLFSVSPEPGKTLNASLVERFVAGYPGGATFVILTLVSEGALLIVGAQAGFLDGPRVLANMAIDSWAPHRFAALSERLTTRNGIVLMGAAAIGALLYTGGAVRHLVIMYSINVFLTFSLSMLGMLRLWFGRRGRELWKRRSVLFAVGLALCTTILTITVVEKFGEGGWLTAALTSACVAMAFLVRRHYRRIATKLADLDRTLALVEQEPHAPPRPFDTSKPTAVILVASYSGLGVHTLLNVIRQFPGHFHNLVFISVGIVDSGTFKGAEELERLRTGIQNDLDRYVALGRRLGFAAQSRLRIGTDRLDQAEALCRDVRAELPRSTFFAGKLIFLRERWFHPILHNQMAYSLQKRLQWQGLSMIILPLRVS